ncbi:MAG: putative zinc-binding protein [Victivallales bacterium]
MSEKNTCACGTAPRLIFPCSGGSDVGELTDKAARKMTRDGAAKMYCLAGVGGRVSGIMATTESAADILVIDGCPLDCAKKTMEAAGFNKFNHLRLSDIGMTKGSTPVSDDNVSGVALEGAKKLSRKGCCS